MSLANLKNTKKYKNIIDIFIKILYTHNKIKTDYVKYLLNYNPSYNEYQFLKLLKIVCNKIGLNFIINETININNESINILSYIIIVYKKSYKIYNFIRNNASEFIIMKLASNIFYKKISLIYINEYFIYWIDNIEYIYKKSYLSSTNILLTIMSKYNDKNNILNNSSNDISDDFKKYIKTYYYNLFKHIIDYGKYTYNSNIHLCLKYIISYVKTF